MPTLSDIEQAMDHADNLPQLSARERLRREAAYMLAGVRWQAAHRELLACQVTRICCSSPERRSCPTFQREVCAKADMLLAADRLPQDIVVEGI